MTVLDYEIRVTGTVPGHILQQIEDVRAVVLPVMTTLTGTVADQAALHGLINRLHGAGLDLIEVRRPAGGRGKTTTTSTTTSKRRQ